MEKQISRVVRGRIELIVDHEGKELAFVYPSEGPNTYQNVGKGILERKLTIPTGNQTASLVYGAYNSQEPEFKEIQNILKNKWLWVFNRILWTPEGVYVVHDSEAVGISQPLDINDLEKRLNTKEQSLALVGGRDPCYGIRISGDETVSFAPKKSYKLGDHTPESLARDGFIIASFGAEGAKKLGEVSTKFEYAPYVYGLNIEKGQDPSHRVSALLPNWNPDGQRLRVNGNCRGNCNDGCAFGV